MTWVKLMDTFPDHPKVLAVGDQAGWLYICGLCYCSKHLTDGRIPTGALPRLTGLPKPERFAEKLVDHGLWEVTATGWNVHGYSEVQRTRNDVERQRESTRVRVRKHRSNGVTNTDVTRPEVEVEVDTEEELETEPKNQSVELVSSNGASPPARPIEKPVDVVFEAWQEATGHRKAVLDQKRRRVISAALKHYPVYDLIDAVRGVTLSGFHNGQNDNGSRYDDLCLILRDAAHIEKFRDLARDGPRMPVSANMVILAKVVADRESR